MNVRPTVFLDEGRVVGFVFWRVTERNPEHLSCGKWLREWWGRRGG